MDKAKNGGVGLDFELRTTLKFGLGFGLVPCEQAGLLTETRRD
jgi:hypothetical protein